MRRIRHTEAEHNLVRGVGKKALLSIYRELVSTVHTHMPLNLSRWHTISNAIASTELETYKINAAPLLLLYNK